MIISTFSVFVTICPSLATPPVDGMSLPRRPSAFDEPVVTKEQPVARFSPVELVVTILTPPGPISLFNARTTVTTPTK